MIEINNSEIRKLLTKKHMKSVDLLGVIRKYKNARGEHSKEIFKDIIFENNVRLIYKMASKRCYGLPVEDLCVKD